MSQHPARRLETGANHQLDRVRTAVLVLGKSFPAESPFLSNGLILFFSATPGTEPRGPTEPRGGRSAPNEPTPLRAQRVQGDAR